MTIFSKNIKTLRTLKMLMVLLTGAVFSLNSLAQQAPPELGQETKGKPAVDETSALPAQQAAAESVARQGTTDGNQEAVKNTRIDNLLGTADVRESKRENGQVYLIELEHSSGAKQYIEETDSDGKIESTSNDIEETPNLPKWKLGSW